jgi:glycosyltransferase involved in cell wall biosynthesis
MKILYLIDNYSLGGAQTIVKGIMDNNLSNQSLFSVALRIKTPTLEMKHSNSISIQSKLKYSIFPLFFLKKFIKSNKIDIVHCQLPRSIVFGYILKRFFIPEIKFIIHEQGDIFESAIYALLLRIIFKKADCIIACSRATTYKMHQRSGISLVKINVIYNYVDLNRFSPGPLYNIDTINIGFAGRIEKRKGWREFLYAANELKTDLKYRFLIAGTGKETPKLLNEILRIGATNVIYKGFTGEIDEFYHSIDLLVIPSHHEPMGMVAVEAMACGTAIIASDVPGLNEVVINGRNGWLIKPGSVEELVFKLHKIFETGNDQKELYIRNGLEDVNAYSYIGFNLKIREIYSRLMLKKNS